MPKGRHGRKRESGGAKKKERAVREALRRERKAGAYLSPGDPDFRSFANQLAVQGLRLRDVPGDGNCLFRALSDQLHDGHTNHVHIRRSVVQYMREHREDFAPFVEDNVSFEDHVSELAKDGVYAGNDAIVAFARCYGASVVIHQLNAPRWEVHAPDPSTGKTLHIAYLNEEHYCSVQALLPDHPLPPLVVPKPQGSQPQTLKSSLGGGVRGGGGGEGRGGWEEEEVEVVRRGGGEEEMVRRVVESTGCQDMVLIERCLQENAYDPDLAIVELLQLITLSTDQLPEPVVEQSLQHGPEDSTCADRQSLGEVVCGRKPPAQPPAQPQRHLSNRERKEAAKAARKERRQKERMKKGEGERPGEHDLIGAMAI